MKTDTPKLLFHLVVVLVLPFVFYNAAAQNVAINSTGNPPDPSSMLDITETGKGILIPRMLLANRPATPVTSLLIYQTDNNPGYYYWNGSWVRLSVGGEDGWTDDGTVVRLTTITDKVGIGITNPIGRLDVQGPVARSGVTATSPSFYVSGTLSTGQTGPASGNIEFRHDNGTQGIGFGYNTIYQTGSNANQELNLLSRGNSPITLNAYAYSTGNVGIGTPTPGSKLEVAGQVKITGGAPGAKKVLTSDASGLATWQRPGGDPITGSVTAGNWYRIASNSGNRANAEFTLRDYISGGGHSTLTFRAGTSYNYATGMSFTVLDHSYYGTPTFTKIRILQATTYDPQYLEVYANRTGSVDFSIYDNLQSSGWVEVAWTAGSIPGGYTVREFDVDKLFVVGDYDDRFTINRGGNVGIGTVSPQSRLTVTGDGSGVANIGGGFCGGNYTGISLNGLVAGCGNYNLLSSTSDQNLYLNRPSGYDMYFRENNATQMMIASGGNVGIGTAAPTYKLHVIGRLKTNGVNETSDIRLKENISALENALEKVLALRGVSYTWKVKEFPEMGLDRGEQIGLIAQEIENIVPEVVSTDSAGWKSVEYSHVVPLLIEAIKEQQKLIVELQNENAGLEIYNQQHTEHLDSLSASVEKLYQLLELESKK